MELVLSTQNLGRLPKQKQDLINKPSGFLNSQYKDVVKASYKNQKTTSIFGIKQRVKSRRYTTSCVAETTLKLSLFLIIVLLIF